MTMTAPSLPTPFRSAEATPARATRVCSAVSPAAVDAPRAVPHTSGSAAATGAAPAPCIAAGTVAAESGTNPVATTTPATSTAAVAAALTVRPRPAPTR